jgi:hypothetical protein
MEINAILEDIGWGKYQYLVIVNVALSWGLTNSWFIMVSIAIDELKTAWDLDTFVAGLVGT